MQLNKFLHHYGFNHTPAVAVVGFHIVILFCQNAFVMENLNQKGPLTFNTPLPVSFEYIWQFAGTGGSVVITPKIIPASIPVKIKSLVTLLKQNQHQRQVHHYIVFAYLTHLVYYYH
jgi:hypothetical protein